MKATRCKPGQLAMIVRAESSWTQAALGTVLRVTCIDSDASELCGKPMWVIDAPRVAAGRIYNRVADAILQPLRDQDDPEADEMLLIAGDPRVREAA